MLSLIGRTPKKKKKNDKRIRNWREKSSVSSENPFNNFITNTEMGKKTRKQGCDDLRPWTPSWREINKGQHSAIIARHTSPWIHPGIRAKTPRLHTHTQTKCSPALLPRSCRILKIRAMAHWHCEKLIGPQPTIPANRKLTGIAAPPPLPP